MTSVAAVAAGVILRLIGLWEGRSLQMDEALLAQGICGRSFAGLLEPLDLNQAAPIDFLMLERLSILAFGINEAALPLFPCLASIASIGLVYRICRAELGREAGAVGLMLAAFSPTLLYFGAETKQYAFDAAAILLVLDQGATVLREGYSARRLASLAAIGAVLVWFSHPVIFALAGVGMVLFLDRALHGSRAQAGALVGVGACWIASFLVDYAIALGSLQNHAVMNDYWQFAFLPFPPRSLRDLFQYPSVFVGLFDMAFFDSRTWLPGTRVERGWAFFALGLWFVGAAALIRRGRGKLLALLVSPLAFAVVAAMFRKYPMRARLVVFDLSPNLVIIAAGIAALMDRVRGRAGAVVRLGGVGLLLAMIGPYVSAMLRRPHPYGMRVVLEELAREATPGDPVYVDWTAEPTFEYYRRFGRIEGLDRLGPVTFLGGGRSPEEQSRSLAEFRGRPRIWVVSEEEVPAAEVALRPGGAEPRDRTNLDGSGKLLVALGSPGALYTRPAHAELYDTR